MMDDRQIRMSIIGVTWEVQGGGGKAPSIFFIPKNKFYGS
jgi:hypothetical protein